MSKKSKNKVKPRYELEQYQIYYDIQNESGYWERHKFVTIDVDLSLFPDEKNNHFVAEKILKDRLTKQGIKFQIGKIIYV